MTLIQFQVLEQVGWRGKTYLPGLQAIPEELAVALGWSPDDKAEGGEPGESGGEKGSTGRRRAQPK
ncbi:MAG: hypothetical protein RM021_018530 [Nostoc sp. EkiNYC01]|nr:hypothetical protein [Nostoc sp. EkiNYC01]